MKNFTLILAVALTTVPVELFMPYAKGSEQLQTNSASQVSSLMGVSVTGATNQALPSNPASGSSILPPDVLAFLGNPKATLDFSKLPMIGPAGQAELAQRYQATTNIFDKHRVALVLATVGDEKVVGLLSATLTNEFGGVCLSDREAMQLSGLAVLMGELAERYDSAFDFLERGIDPAFWQRLKQFDPRPGIWPNEGALVHSCLLGLGRSGRPAALELLLEFRSGKRALTENCPVGVVVEAASFYYREQEQKAGKLPPPPAYPNGDDLMKNFTDWYYGTPEGREWRAWSQKMRGITDKMVVPAREPSSAVVAPGTK